LLIGEGYYSLEALANLIDNPATVNLIGSTFEVHGKLELNITPVNPDGTSEELDFIPDEPTDLIDQRIDFVVEIIKAYDLPEDLCRDIYVEYSFYLDPTKYKTDVIEGKERSPMVSYKKHHTVEIVTKMLVDYLEKEVMVFRMYGFADVKEKKKKDMKRASKKLINSSADQSTNDSINSSMLSQPAKFDPLRQAPIVQSSQSIKAEPMKSMSDPLAAQRVTGMQSSAPRA
jgi:hypothetical protein